MENYKHIMTYLDVIKLLSTALLVHDMISNINKTIILLYAIVYIIVSIISHSCTENYIETGDMVVLDIIKSFLNMSDKEYLQKLEESYENKKKES